MDKIEVLTQDANLYLSRNIRLGEQESTRLLNGYYSKGKYSELLDLNNYLKCLNLQFLRLEGFNEARTAYINGCDQFINNILVKAVDSEKNNRSYYSCN